MLVLDWRYESTHLDRHNRRRHPGQLARSYAGPRQLAGRLEHPGQPHRLHSRSLGRIQARQELLTYLKKAVETAFFVSSLYLSRVAGLALEIFRGVWQL